MSTETLLFIIIAGVISLALAIFMYGYKSGHSRKMNRIFGSLRFLTLFTTLLLIINPKFYSETYFIEKPKLPVLIDNSESVAVLEQKENAINFIEKLRSDKDLNEKFDVYFYTFGSDFKSKDSLSFLEKNTNISKALQSTFEIFKNQTAPIILLTDGNHTIGTDYEFEVLHSKHPIFPVILGDSVQHPDLKIEQLNTNRYAFLKNKFPVETILTYSGNEEIQTEFVIREGDKTIHRESVLLSEKSNSKTIHTEITANEIGLKKYTAEILPLENEKNKTNNSKHFAVEVIDQATQVLIVSSIRHPDIGSLIKSITSNEQRKVEVKKPSEALSILDEYQLIILYQPDRHFIPLFPELEKSGKNTWMIAGLQTEWNQVNRLQKNFIKKATSAKDEVQGELNSNYGSFAVEDISFDRFPPLHTRFGTVELMSENQILLKQIVHGIENENPLLVTFEIDGKRHALWDGEGFWRWRASSFIREGNFRKYDDFIGNMVQYLASSKKRSRLEVFSESFYYNSQPIKISAQYFDKNYVFDRRASLLIHLKNKETEEFMEFPLLLRNNYYEVDISNLPAGEYDFTVSVAEENISRSGSLTVLEFNVEQQFLNAAVGKLNRVADQTGGKAFFPNESEDLIQTLLENSTFKNIQKSEQKTIPLIDWRYLLAILAVLLAAEWFIRKYNGLV